MRISITSPVSGISVRTVLIEDDQKAAPLVANTTMRPTGDRLGPSTFTKSPLLSAVQQGLGPREPTAGGGGTP